MSNKNILQSIKILQSSIVGVFEHIKSNAFAKKILFNMYFYLICSVFCISIYGFFMHTKYHALHDNNMFVQSMNIALKQQLHQYQQMDFSHFKPVPHLSALLDYRLKMIPNIEITYSDIEEKDGLICTYKSILYKTTNITNCLFIIKYIQQFLLQSKQALNQDDNTDRNTKRHMDGNMNVLNKTGFKSSPCIFYLLDIKFSQGMYVMVIDFYFVSSKYIK